MNKTYFAKYLPVDGEIKEGDIVMGTNGVSVIWGVKSKHGLQYYGWDESIQYMKSPRKVKMFICSRNIKEGDEIYLSKINEYHKFKYETEHRITCQSINGIHDEDFDVQDRFKIIGEISPEAIWVKEGDEFDEEQIGILYNFVGEDIDEQLFTTEDFWKKVKQWYKGKKVPSYVNPPISIKCPTCGHFH